MHIYHKIYINELCIYNITDSAHKKKNKLYYKTNSF